jgi:hypothetical protein
LQPLSAKRNSSDTFRKQPRVDDARNFVNQIRQQICPSVMTTTFQSLTLVRNRRWRALHVAPSLLTDGTF